jgi:hypothetical protein
LKILKPAYNNIDMVEVELMDDRSEPREFGKQLLDVSGKEFLKIMKLPKLIKTISIDRSASQS